MNLEEQWAGIKFLWSGFRMANWRCMLGRHPEIVTIELPGGGNCHLCSECESEVVL